MRSLKKPLMLLVAIAIVVSVSVYATVAYLTDTEDIKNVFTVGKVDIILDETDTDTNGNPLKNGSPVVGTDEPDRITDGNSYHLIPGNEYVKDPMVTVKSGSEPCYVRMILSINKLKEIKALYGDSFIEALDGNSLLIGKDPTIWSLKSKSESFPTPNTGIYEFRLMINGSDRIVNAKDGDIELDPLFDSFAIPDEATQVDLYALQDLVISIEAHAIQAEGFADADEAWTAFDSQNVSSGSGSNAIQPGSGLEAMNQTNEQLAALAQAYSELQTPPV